MRRTVIRALLLAALGVLLLTAAACGGDDDESAADTQAAAATTTTGSDDTTEAAGTDAEEDSDLDFSGGSEECQELAALGTKVSAALSGTGADTEKTTEFLNEFADKAPDEIKDDFQVIADAYVKIADALGDTNLAAGETPDPGALAKLQELATEIDQTALQEANTNITAWVTENCSGR